MFPMNHHLTDQLLMGYSAGALPEAFNLVAATHISLCDDCRAQLAEFDTLGGSLLQASPPAALADGSLQATLARIAGARAEPARSPKGALPAPLRDYVGPDLDQVKWRPVGMGVKQMILPTSKAASARLLHIPPGVAMPGHGHRGIELTLVLQGAFRDATDRFGPGDIEVADEAIKHTPVAEPGQPCICLAATDAPLRFTGLVPRLVQALFRI